MEHKFFIIGLYQGINDPFECFSPTESFFNSIQSCEDWISFHRKYFAPSVRFGIYSLDNSFDYGRSENKNL